MTILPLIKCEMGRKGTPADNSELSLTLRDIPVDESAPKLRSLARQSRALALIVADEKRTKSLQSLARLYERQAAELELA